MSTSRFARALAAAEHGHEEVMDGACAAGLLHDTGHVVLAAHLPREWADTLSLARAEGDSRSRRRRSACWAPLTPPSGPICSVSGACPTPSSKPVAYHHTPVAVSQPAA